MGVAQLPGLGLVLDVLGLGEQMILQRLAVLVEQVRGTVKAVQVHGLEVKAEQLAQR